MNIIELYKSNQDDNYNYFFENIDYNNLKNLVDLLVKYKDNNIYFTGVGKSNNIARHISDIFKCVGMKAFEFNLLNLTHGDFGCIKDDDLIIFFSNSGNTKEIIQILKTIKNNKIYKILICSNKNAKINEFVNETFIVPVKNESDLKFNLIPTNSVINNLMYFNLVINFYITKTNLKLEEYKNNHPSGNIGFRTKKIKEFINYENTFYDPNITIKEVILLLKENKSGLIFTNKEDKLLGIITTKDLLNILENNINNNECIRPYINENPIILNDSEELICNKIDEIKKFKFFKLIPVLKDGKVIGVLDNSKILEYL